MVLLSAPAALKWLCFLLLLRRLSTLFAFHRPYFHYPCCCFSQFTALFLPIGILLYPLFKYILKKFSILVKLRWLRPKRRRQIALREYLQCICTLTASNGDIIDDAEDQSIHDYAFKKGTVVDLACQYLTFLAITQRTAPTGINEAKFKLSAFQHHAVTMVLLIRQGSGDVGTAGWLLKPGRECIDRERQLIWCRDMSLIKDRR